MFCWSKIFLAVNFFELNHYFFTDRPFNTNNWKKKLFLFKKFKFIFISLHSALLAKFYKLTGFKRWIL